MFLSTLIGETCLPYCVVQAMAPAFGRGQYGAPGLGAEGIPLGQAGAAQSPEYSEGLPTDASGMFLNSFSCRSSLRPGMIQDIW